MQKAKLFTKDFMFDASISLCCSLNYFTLLINMVGFATVTFGATEAEAGLAAGLYVIGGLLSRVFLGKYIELVGRKRMLIIALAMALIMSCTYFFVSGTSLFVLFAIRLLHGVSYGLVSSCTGDIIAKILPAERRGEGLGYFYLSVTVAMAIGPFLGMEFGRYGDYNLVFSVGLVMYTLALLLAFFLNVPEETLDHAQAKDAHSFSLRNLFQFSAIPLALVSMVFYFSYSGVLSFISTYAETVDLVEVAMYFYLAVAAGTFISRLTTGKIYDTRGPNIIMLPAFVVFVVGMLMFANVDGAVMMYAAGFLMGYGVSIVYSICQAIVVSKSPAHRYGVTTSTFAAFTDLGTGLGPSLLGMIVAGYGFHDMYVICAGIAVVSLVIYMALHGARHGWRNESQSF